MTRIALSITVAAIIVAAFMSDNPIAVIIFGAVCVFMAAGLWSGVVREAIQNEMRGEG